METLGFGQEFKTALISFAITKMDHMTMCKVKDVARIDDPTKK